MQRQGYQLRKCHKTDVAMKIYDEFLSRPWEEVVAEPRNLSILDTTPALLPLLMTLWTRPTSRTTLGRLGVIVYRLVKMLTRASVKKGSAHTCTRIRTRKSTRKFTSYCRAKDLRRLDPSSPAVDTSRACCYRCTICTSRRPSSPLLVSPSPYVCRTATRLDTARSGE